MASSALPLSNATDTHQLIEFHDSLTLSIAQIEKSMGELSRTPKNLALINSVFRAIHNIKGDASLCEYAIGEIISHPIENLLSRLRKGEITFSPVLADTIMLALDRLELSVEELMRGGTLTHLKLDELIDGLEHLAATPQPQIENAALKLIDCMTGLHPVSDTPRTHGPASAPAQGRAAKDLAFFHSLAIQFEAHSPLFKGRSERLLRLALETNEAAGQLVDPVQLEAAIYMHDLGMLFLPSALWLNSTKLSEEEREKLKNHPHVGAGLLQRMPGWQEAARMVLQHHEMPDGKGYPNGLKINEICHGAQILAIVDTFEAVTLKHSQRGDKRSLVRAIAEINAGDKQFAPQWINAFNTVVRRMIEG